MREKVFTFLTHKSKPGVVQAMLVLVKVLSGQYHSYPLTQLAVTEKCLCKYYISMIEGVHMFPKMSTRVDQNLASESTTSQLSVAIFMASRTNLGTQKCIILGFFPQLRHIPALDPTNLGFCLICTSA